MKGMASACNVNADVVIYKPDGSVFHEVKSLELQAISIGTARPRNRR